MPQTREALLDAACAVLARRPWPRVRMTDVAAMAGVSRQTLYNEFGSKDGLGRALLRREADSYLAGVDRVLTPPGPPAERLAAVAEWTVGAARASAMLRALLTGCWSTRLPTPQFAAVGPMRDVPGQRRFGRPSPDPGREHPPPAPGDLLDLVRDRSLTALCGPTARAVPPELLVPACEIAVRLALSCVVAPKPEAGALVREALTPLLAAGP
ncbi:TetR/AcrR family transcriptional regulator [Streptomyces sp. NA04227]|uniref:TetR/AcrR family transcriptional regulator n=1 Tax=Streptomyces sp. NA04227 TaxID=2742136 RepID=UPI0015928945|nr:TetR/AcrR family transcriptional regulator [Streptomyces sp. NA04227]QKW09044.1 TetR/AcrR family transcriptional regulator [Streptomyces sp. NA04227]